MQFFTANEAKAGLYSGKWTDQVMAAHFFKENPSFVSVAMTELVILMGHHQPLVRDAAVIALGKASEEVPDVQKVILERMNNTDEIIRSEAAHAAGYCDNSAEIFGQKLLIMLKEDSSTAVRRRAAQALGRLSYLPSIKALQIASNDKDVDVREEAELALSLMHESLVR